MSTSIVAGVATGVLVLPALPAAEAPQPAQIAAAEAGQALLGVAPTRTANDTLLVGPLHGGAAVAYVKFDVPAGRPAGGGSVRFTRIAGPLPAYLEISLVAGDWTPRGGMITDPPVPGTAVAAARPGPADPSVTFDVSRVIRAAGRYAFAVTAPTGQQPARFTRGGRRLVRAADVGS